MSSLTRQGTQWRGTQWRDSGADAERIAREWPILAQRIKQPASRRQVMRLMAASAALAGLGGCHDPADPQTHYVPAVNPAPDIVPGLPNHYATALIDGGAAAGIVVRQDMGRPIKIEGNPNHPASLGSTSIFGQALLLDFYDPDRSSGVLNAGIVSTWQSLLSACLQQRTALASNAGQGLRILTGRVVSPTLGAAIDGVLHRYGQARWHQWSPVSRDTIGNGMALAYGQRLDLLPRVANADVILALDSDVIDGAPGYLRHAREFASRRNPVRAKISRVYAAEPVPTLIGGAADHRFVAGPGEMHAVVTALAAELLDDAAPQGPAWVNTAAADLRKAGSRALIHAGPSLPAEAHALIHRINEKLGARGSTFDLVQPAAYRAEDEGASMAALIEDMRAGQVTTLLILDSNPVYAAKGFRDALPHVKFSLSLSPAPDETAHAVTWYVPGTHVFEDWGDAVAHDGTVAIQQPQALPLYGGRSALEALALLTQDAPVSARDMVRQTWRERMDDVGWRDALAAGVVPNTARAPEIARLRDAAAPVPSQPPDRPLNLLIRPDPSLLDGRHANNPWLQELPRPIGKIVWDNPLLLAPRTAARLSLANGDEVELTAGNVKLRAPIWIVPGQAEDCVAGWLGGGRTHAGSVGNGVGTDVTPLTGIDAAVSLRKTGRNIPIASTDHYNILEVDGKTVDSIVRHATLAEFASKRDLLRDPGDTGPSIYHRPRTPGVAWGMSVDLNACIGCNACVVACQAENNVPVVGKDQVMLGREMHWLRIDRYFEGPPEAPDSLLQPMLCMQCEDAPCEPVCPVEASIHDSEGLNVQVYNRCIGTRFCSNNCPYKVRRFNFGAWAAEEKRPPISRNPDVTVRSRGVMEKCTFCIQRIATARLAHDIHGVPEQAVTACQAACPTQAFTFGDINDPNAEVTKRKASPLDYALLADQNTHPRLTYEGIIRNPNPDVSA
jgi:Fe-S-cluster-containing dehydrogenase component